MSHELYDDWDDDCGDEDWSSQGESEDPESMCFCGGHGVHECRCCGMPLCAMHSETGAGFCHACPTEDGMEEQRKVYQDEMDAKAEDKARSETMQAGTWRAITYAFFVLVDEVLHAIPLIDHLAGSWLFRFCQWAHRYDGMDQGTPEYGHEPITESAVKANTPTVEVIDDETLPF